MWNMYSLLCIKTIHTGSDTNLAVLTDCLQMKNTAVFIYVLKLISKKKCFWVTLNHDVWRPLWLTLVQWCFMSSFWPEGTLITRGGLWPEVSYETYSMSSMFAMCVFSRGSVRRPGQVPACSAAARFSMFDPRSASCGYFKAPLAPFDTM